MLALNFDSPEVNLFFIVSLTKTIVLFFGFSIIIFSWFGVPSGSLCFRFPLQRFINLSTLYGVVKGFAKRILCALYKSYAVRNVG